MMIPFSAPLYGHLPIFEIGSQKKTARNVSATWENIPLIQWFNTPDISHQAPVWAQVAKPENQFLLGRHTLHVERQIRHGFKKRIDCLPSHLSRR
jgi:hypothetical protein